MAQAVYPGSFDPITNGHLDIIKRAVKIFDKLTVAVVCNPSKVPLFTAVERVEMISSAVKSVNPEIEIKQFNGLLVDFAQSIKAYVVLRGLRAVSDFEFEFQLSLMNQNLNPDIQMVYLMSGSNVTYLSSSLIKEIAHLGGNVSSFVPEIVTKYLAAKFNGCLE